MRKTIVTCDHCKQDVTAEGAHEVRLFVGQGNYAPFKAEEWCRACIVGVLGAWPQKPGDPPKPEPPPTLEDMIREIAGEAAIEAVQNR